MKSPQTTSTQEELDELISALRDVKKEFLMSIPGISTGINDMLREFEGYREMLDRPASILLMGRTGAGKSSFINSLVGDPNLTPVGESAYAQTKHVQAIPCTTPDGTPLVFLDTRGSGEAGLADSETQKEISVAADLYRPSVAIVLMPPDRARWDEDLAFFASVLNRISERLQLVLPVLGVLTKVDTVVMPFRPDRDYDWRNPESTSERKIADWCERLEYSLRGQLGPQHLETEVVPVCTRFGLDDDDAPIDMRWGLDEVWAWLGKRAPFELLMSLSEFSSMDRRRAMATNLVHRFSIMAGVVGALPISLADAPVLAYLQQVLVRVIYTIAQDPEKSPPKDYFRFIGGTTQLVGRIAAKQLVTSLTELIPGWGTVVGSAGNAAIATAFTEMFGHAAVQYYFDGMDLSDVVRIIKRFKIPKTSPGSLTQRLKRIRK